jgi:hypothetical protein
VARDPLDKVRKLLALARSADVHEAAAAAAAAQAMVERYRLQDLLEAREASEQDPVEEEVLETARRRRRWKTVLASGLADVNACLAFTRDAGRDKQIVLAGRAADRAAVRSLWDWLVPQLEWLSATHGAGRDKRWHDDFRIGAIDTILERLRGVHEQERGQLDGAALVRLDPALVERRAALERFSQERLRPGKGRRLLVGVDAWKAGRAAAAEVSIGE